MTSSDTLVSCRHISKKFCRTLKRSLFYGLSDLFQELTGRAVSPTLRAREFWALRDVSLDLCRGEVLGLIGPNGAGKTTLIRMVNGLLKPTEGVITTRGRMVALIALGAGFNPVLTGRENIYVNAAILGLSKAEVSATFDRIVEFAGVEEFIEAPVQSYSSGMIVRLGFAVAAHVKPDILLVDEVLAVGDLGFQRKCLDKIGELRDGGTGIILVSHNMHTISSNASRVSVLSRGTSTLFDDVSQGIQAYRENFPDIFGREIQKICSGNDSVRFDDVTVSETRMSPGDPFVFELGYSAEVTIRNVEIDLGIYSSNEPNLHFQATNHAYGQTVDLAKGRHLLRIVLEDIRINGGKGLVVCTVWTQDRRQQLFWWRVPVDFGHVDHSSGNNFVNVRFEQLETNAPRMS